MARLPWNELTTTFGTTGFYTVREVTFVAAGLGIPVFLLGVVTMLLGSDRVTALAGVGVAACLGAVSLFVATYPGSHCPVSSVSPPPAPVTASSSDESSVSTADGGS